MKGIYKLQCNNNLFCLLMFIYMAIFLSACQKEIVKKSPSLWEAKSIHSQVEQLQGNPTHNLLRNDWQPLKDVLKEGHFVYPVVPYFPYIFYNIGITYTKETILLPASLVTGGSDFQDETDIWLIDNSLKYKELYHQIWADPKHANFFNMDEKITKNFSSGVE